MSEINSHTLYPSIMQSSRLLIIDYDVIRFHSFDLLRYKLMDRELFKTLDPMFIEMLTMKSLADQVDFFRKTAQSFNPFDCMDVPKTTYVELEEALQKMFLDTNAKITPTDIFHRFDITFEHPGITGCLLRYKNDPNVPTFKSEIAVYESDKIFDMAMAIAIIKKHNINAIMLASVEMALLLANKLAAVGYKSPISFIIANHRYNYEGDTMKHSTFMNALEFTYKHEFGVFDPYSGLSYKKKVLKSEEEL